MLQIRNLQIGYKELLATSFHADASGLIAIIGENGSGKSTLLKTISGFNKAINGKISYQNIDLSTLSEKNREEIISICFPSIDFFTNIFVDEFIYLSQSRFTNFFGFIDKLQKEHCHNIMRDLKIWSWRKRQLNELSDGEKQLVNICRALCQQSPILILDEPTSFLDFKNKALIYQYLKNESVQNKRTIILSSHDIEGVLEVADTIWLFDHQTIFVLDNNVTTRDRINAMRKSFHS